MSTKSTVKAWEPLYNLQASDHEVAKQNIPLVSESYTPCMGDDCAEVLTYMKYIHPFLKRIRMNL